MKQKTQGRELSALVPASFVFSDYDEYAVISYSFTLALYKLTIGEDVRQAFLQWERFPFSEEAECFLESLSAYAELPSIADGYWKMVDRNPGTSAYTNVSLCVYDGATGAAYLLTMDI